MKYEDITQHPEILEYYKKGNAILDALGYTDHSVAHTTLVAKKATELLQALGYGEQEVENEYQQTLNTFVGPTKVLVSGETLQLKDYSATDWPWTMFDPDARINRHDTVFPEECRKAFEMGLNMAGEEV